VKAVRAHLFHIINPAPWPILISMIVFNLLIGVILWINKYIISNNIIIISFIILLIFIGLWFRDVIREGLFEGKHTLIVQKGLKLGMILFIVSEIMFFFGFFWAYFHFALSPSIEIGCLWPPYGIQVFNYLDVPLLNTIILLLSGVFITWSHHNIILNKTENWEDIVIGFQFTIGLALCFTLCQLIEYIEASFNITDSVYGSIFFMGTGFHGFHVILGTIFLTVCYNRFWEEHFSTRHHLGLECAIWYWHFVDVVWLFLYICIYWWASTSLI
jgi:cytochrome c oxidase subunit 3